MVFTLRSLRSDCVEVLEAAHVIPYREDGSTNHVTNGILLRSDLHTLFDLGLLSIDVETWTVKIAEELEGTSHESLSGGQFRLPANPVEWPNREALKNRCTQEGFWGWKAFSRS